ncbi:GNAT family N-acetyltransferase [Photorhabdus antumapuensis]|uniref:GNAT family N-acetyltransferase n=1 Tax=Photorhabdus antumapuensis TaxID=2862867 RepID=UPI001CEC90DE|nr:GNAT family N-acetyltransferase [Photorhabdus antumapuensis]MCA6221507.1 GNAT family N-acetyltransferase [Photorhabdus antumapuensis]
MGSEDIKIRKVSLTEWNRVVKWQRDEQWDLGIDDEVCYFSADPAGFYMGYQGDRAVSAMSVVKFGEKYSHVGHFLVAKKMRNKGMGLKTWEHVIRRVDTTASSGLDSVVEQKAAYEKWGYVEAYRIFRLRGELEGSVTKRDVSSISIVTDLNLSKVVEFDEGCVGYNRKGLLKNWFVGPGRSGWIYENGGAIAAVFGARLSTDGVRLGPIYARDTSTFFFVLAHIADQFPRHTMFTIDIPEFSLDEIGWLKSVGFKELFYTYRMFRGAASSEKKGLIKAIASLDVG